MARGGDLLRFASWGITTTCRAIETGDLRTGSNGRTLYTTGGVSNSSAILKERDSLVASEA